MLSLARLSGNVRPGTIVVIWTHVKPISADTSCVCVVQHSFNFHTSINFCASYLTVCVFL